MNYLVIISLILIGGEIGTVMYYWGDLMILVSGNWMMSFLAFLRLISWPTIVSFLKRTLIISFWEIVKGYIIGWAALHIFKYPLLDNWKNVVLKSISNTWSRLVIYWKNEKKYVKLLFIIAVYHYYFLQ